MYPVYGRFRDGLEWVEQGQHIALQHPCFHAAFWRPLHSAYHKGRKNLMTIRNTRILEELGCLRYELPEHHRLSHRHNWLTRFFQIWTNIAD